MSGYFPKLLHGWETWKRKSLSPAQNLVSGRIFPAFITPVRFQWHVSKNPHKSSGWWFQPLWKIWKSVGMIVPYILENKKCLKPPTSHHGSHSKIPQNPHKSIINPLPGRKNAQPPGVDPPWQQGGAERFPTHRLGRPPLVVTARSRVFTMTSWHSKPHLS